MGLVLEVDLTSEPGEAWKKFIRIRVEVDIAKPLSLGVFLPRPNISDLWIGLKYEKIADNCYHCDSIGHDQKSCSAKMFHLNNPSGKSFKVAGLWLRVENDDVPDEIVAQSATPDSVSSPKPYRQQTDSQNSWQRAKCNHDCGPVLETDTCTPVDNVNTIRKDNARTEPENSGMDDARTEPENSRMELSQLASDLQHLSSQYEVGLDSYVNRNPILLTPVTIGLQIGSNSSKPFSSQQ